MKYLRHLWVLVLLALVQCSPESQFLNTAEKREVSRRTEHLTTTTFPIHDSICKVRQDSLMPYLIDSIMEVRTEEMRRKLEVK
jgi:hypothetical protein